MNQEEGREKGEKQEIGRECIKKMQKERQRKEDREAAGTPFSVYNVLP